MRERRILLIGSTGYLGKALMMQQSAHVVPTHRTNAYFAGSQRYDFWTDNVQPLLQAHQIDTVIIAANMAYEEAGPAHAFTTFKQQAAQLIRGCQRCRVVYISSDGIFDGKQGNYVESYVPVPMTPYGRNLQCLEQLVQRHCVDYCIIRPSYLYGYSQAQLDRRLTHVRARLLAGEHLTYFSDMIKSPMEVNQVANVITLLAHSNYVGIVHVAGAAMSVYDFYREAMGSLNVPTEHLHPAHMPIDLPHPRDTSLDTALMRKLTGIEPLSVHRALLGGVSLAPLKGTE